MTMKLDEAKATAIGMTSRFCGDFAVFRLSGWVDGEWGIRKADEIPAGATIHETYRHAQPQLLDERAEGRAREDLPSVPTRQAQRGLFELDAEPDPPAVSTQGPSTVLISVLAWAEERLANSERIRQTKDGDDRAGWAEDVAYWREIVNILRSDDRARLSPSASLLL